MKNKPNVICDRHLIPLIVVCEIVGSKHQTWGCGKCSLKRIGFDLAKSVEAARFFAWEEMLHGSKEKDKTKKVWNGLRRQKGAEWIPKRITNKLLKKAFKNQKMK